MLFRSAYDTGSDSIVGAKVLIENYVDQFNFDSWQKVSIPFADLGLVSTDFDAIRMSLEFDGAGKAPKFYIDDMDIQQTGTTFEFRTFTKDGSRFCINKIRVIVTDAVTGGLSYDKLLGVPKLANGLVVSRVHKGEVTFATSLTCLGEVIENGFTVSDFIDDGVNTMIALELNLDEPMVVTGGINSYISVTISDDMSGLISLRTMAHGAIEINT